MPAALPVIADPLRWSMLQALANSDLRVHELTALTGAQQNLVSYHLRELRSAGLVSSRRSSQDGRDSYYRVDLERCSEVLRLAGLALDPSIRLELRQPEPGQVRARGLSVLFLCTGNSARSQMAAALLDHRSGHAITARSAGSHPKPLHPYAVATMAERGIDIASAKPRHLSRYTRSRFSSVVTVCDRVREICPQFPGSPRTCHWSIADPAAFVGDEAACMAAFRAVADDLDVRITSLIARVANPEGDVIHER